MNLLALAAAVWRHKLATWPVILGTIAGAVYILAFTEPLYEAKSSYAFINPPGAPTQADVARDPALAGVRADNPFTRFPDQSVIVDILARRVNSQQVRAGLVEAGADHRYEVVPSRRFASTTPIAEIVGIGPTPGRAMVTMRLVGESLETELRRLQASEDVDDRYMIRALQVESSNEARQRVSSKLRSMVGVLGLGALLTFTSVSIAEGIGTRRAERRKRSATGTGGGGRDGGRRRKARAKADDGTADAGQRRSA